jgi:hypothetical protein
MVHVAKSHIHVPKTLSSKAPKMKLLILLGLVVLCIWAPTRDNSKRSISYIVEMGKYCRYPKERKDGTKKYCELGLRCNVGEAWYLLFVGVNMFAVQRAGAVRRMWRE